MERVSSTFRITISQRPSVVWNALTRPNDLKRWFLREARLELYPDGNYKFFWGEKISGKYPVIMSGTCFEVVPEKFLKLTWNSPNDFVQFTLEGREDETLLTVHVDGFERGSKGHIDESRGWTFYLINLKTVLERDWDLRDSNSKHTLQAGFVNYYSYK